MFFIWYRNLILANFIIYVYKAHFKELESQSLFFYSSRRCYYNNMNHVMMYYIQAPFGLRSMFTRLYLPLFFFFFIAFPVGSVYCSRDPQTSFFNKIFIKNGSYSTIHIFKNYFTIMFLIFSFQQNKRYLNAHSIFEFVMDILYMGKWLFI